MLSVAVGGTCTSRSARIAAITNRNEMPFRPKHATMPKRGERDAGDDRADHARQVELDRVERHGVRQVLLADERRDQRLVGRPAERLRRSPR